MKRWLLILAIVTYPIHARETSTLETQVDIITIFGTVSCLAGAIYIERSEETEKHDDVVKVGLYAGSVILGFTWLYGHIKGVRQ